MIAASKLIGMNVNQAKSMILEQFPTMIVHTVAVGSKVSNDYNAHRVRLWYDKSAFVAEVTIG